MDMQRLVRALNASRNYFDSQHQNLSQQQRDDLWELNLAKAQRLETHQDSSSFQQHSANFEVAANMSPEIQSPHIIQRSPSSQAPGKHTGPGLMNRSFSQPAITGSKRQRLSDGSAHAIHASNNAHDFELRHPHQRRASNISTGAQRHSSPGSASQQQSATSNTWLGNPTSGLSRLLRLGQSSSTTQPAGPPTTTGIREYSPEDYSKQVEAADYNDTVSTSGTSFHTPVSPYQGSQIFGTSPPDHPLEDQTEATSGVMSRNGSLYSKFENLAMAAPKLSRNPSSASQHSPEHYRGDAVSPNDQPIPTLSTYNTQFLGYIGGSTGQYDTFSSGQMAPPMPQISEDSVKMERTSSSDSNTSRLSRRTREQNLSANRALVPALKSTTPSTSASLQVNAPDSMSQPMSRTASTESQKRAIPANFKPRVERQKLYCDKCNERPEGYKGDHELQRHQSIAHSNEITVFVCLETMSDTDFLANCEQCRNFKQYKAYYNAAAHLRRRHFNPKPKRNGKVNDEDKRGGKGGGKEPPMDVLKRGWFIEFIVDKTGKPVDPAFEKYYKPGITERVCSKSSQKDTRSQHAFEEDSEPAEETGDILATTKLFEPVEGSKVPIRAPNAIGDLTASVSSLNGPHQYPPDIPDHLVGPNNDDDDLLTNFDASALTDSPFFANLANTWDMNFPFDPTNPFSTNL